MKGSVSIVAVGKLREPAWISAQRLYADRLRRYTRLSLQEVKDSVGRGRPDRQAQAEEGKALLAAASPARLRIALTPAGKSYSSEALATFLDRQIDHFGHIAFLIGGPVGLADSVLESVPVQLALSALTFPHELARIVLLEQLYRAFTILSGEKYHK